MTRRRPTEELEHEHRIIQQVVGAMAVLTEKLESGDKIDTAVLTDLSEFMQTFGDTCHHGKEKKYLFKLLERKGVPPSGCPLAVLLHEHEKGRSLMADLKLTSETYMRTPGAGKEALIGTLRRLIELYPAHIWKEVFSALPDGREATGVLASRKNYRHNLSSTNLKLALTFIMVSSS